MDSLPVVVRGRAPRGVGPAPGAGGHGARQAQRVAQGARRAGARAGALLAVLLVAIVGGCGLGPPDHVRIGLVAPMTGPRAAIGEQMLRGAQLAIEDLNASGGLLGEQVELVVTDSAELTDLPRRLADLAERARVSAVIGPESPGIVLGPRSPLSRREVPAVLPSAFAGDLDAASTVVVRTVPGARDQAEALARWLRHERGAEQIAVLVADPVEGQVAREALLAGLAEGGLEVAGVVDVDGTAQALEPAVAALRRQAPDVDAVLVWGWPDVAARATRALRAAEWDVQVAVPSSAFVGTYRGLVADDAEGVVLPFPFERRFFGAAVTSWMLRYQATYGLGSLPDLDTLVLDVPVVALATYDAVGMVAAAVEAADSREPAAVGAALTDVTFEGLLRDYEPNQREAWDAGDLRVARIHHLGVVFDVDPRLDPDEQRMFWELQVSAEYLLDLAPDGPVRALIERLIGDRDLTPPTYQPPLPPPGPVGRPS